MTNKLATSKEWAVGDKVWFDWYSNTAIVGEIVAIKPRLFRQPKYRVMYGVGMFGVKTSEGTDWVQAKDILKPYRPHNLPTNSTKEGASDE